MRRVRAFLLLAFTPLATAGAQPVLVGSWESTLHVFDSNGHSVLEEALPEMAQAIAALPAENGGERLLVGSVGKVWEYRLAGE